MPDFHVIMANYPLFAPKTSDFKENTSFCHQIVENSVQIKVSVA